MRCSSGTGEKGRTRDRKETDEGNSRQMSRDRRHGGEKGSLGPLENGKLSGNI